jgi:ABC-type dipeptide/oligopeptide/nickel transport system permease component
MIFAITLKWLPGGGWNGGALKFMILPMVALSLACASIARITRGSMIEVLHSNFIRTARARVADAADYFPPCVKTCAVASAVLYGTGICRHYHRFDGY